VCVLVLLVRSFDVHHKTNTGGVLLHTVLDRVRQALADTGLGGIIVARPENRFYLSGFTGSAGVLLITKSDAVLLTDFRYVEQARQQSPAFRAVQVTNLHDGLAEMFAGSGAELGFESDYVTVSWLDEFKQRGVAHRLVPAKGLVEKMRAVKTAGELNKIARACEIVDVGFGHILDSLRPGLREIDIALELEFFMRRHGAQALAFDMIVASGKRSAMPHGRASAKRIETGDFVTFDIGVVVDGYCSDMTRTVVVGKASTKQERVYDTVLKAQTAALECIRAGARCSEVDGVARRLIAEAGHAEHFGHGLGHGVGVAVHEQPRLSPVAGDAVLEAGNVVSVEPGIYVDGWGGVRIEDLVAVTEDGLRNFTTSPKQLIQLY